MKCDVIFMMELTHNGGLSLYGEPGCRKLGVACSQITGKTNSLQFSKLAINTPVENLPSGTAIASDAQNFPAPIAATAWIHVKKKLIIMTSL